MSVKNWWSVSNVVETVGTVIPVPLFIIKCDKCGEEYETTFLLNVPQECPEYGHKSEVQ